MSKHEATLGATTASAAEATTTTVIKRGRSSPASKLVSTALSVLVLVLIFTTIIPALGDYGDVWETMRTISIAQLALMAAVFLAGEVMKALVPAVILPELPLTRSVVAEETSSVMSNVLPGPSGTATRFAIYQSWGVDAEAFGRATVVNSVMNNACLLLMPLLVSLPIALEYAIPGKLWAVAIGCGLVSLLGLVALVAILRSEAFARRLGATGGRFVTWFRGLRHRPPPEDMGEAVIEFRDTVSEVVRERWLPIAAVIIGKYLLMAALLLTCVRAVGISSSILPPGLVLGAYVFGRVLSMIEVTPGGIGVTEVIYISLLQLASGGRAESEIVAAVFVFRAFTYFGPMLLGTFGYLVWRLKRSWRVEGALGNPNLATAGVEMA